MVRMLNTALSPADERWEAPLLAATKAPTQAGLLVIPVKDRYRESRTTSHSPAPIASLIFMQMANSTG